jgi:DNA-binding transcriptional LysR family regulator
VARYADTLDAFELPFEALGFSLFLAWHPREHDNPASRWLRDLVRAAVAAAAAPWSAQTPGAAQTS